MNALLTLLELIVFFGLLYLMAYYFKWIVACFTVLSGDKEALRDVGNLCDKEEPFWWQLPPPPAKGNRHWQARWQHPQQPYDDGP